MKDIWRILGTEPTNDKKQIRKAFAAQSRLHHPEEEPEYFAELNQAYKAALEYAAGGAGAVSMGGFQDKEGGTGAGSLGAKIDSSNNEDSMVNNRFVKETQEEESGSGGETAEEIVEETAGEIGGEAAEGTAEETSSLLKLLEEAEERAIEESRQKGALRDFIALFENPKQAKQADTWKRFFLSEAFLGEQYSEEFGKGFLGYLSRQTLYPYDNLPMGLLQELAIAYAFIPHFAGEEYFEGLKYPKEWYKVSVENTFPARKYMAQVFNMQGRECDLKSMTGRMLRQPANKVRHNAFSDYLSMKEMSREGRLTEQEKETWEHILNFCQVCYLYERNGKRLGSADYESRSECVVKLYVQWLKDEGLPESVLKFFYKKLAFKELDRSSTRGLYEPLKAEVLRQLPQAEELLFGETGKEQLITKLYRVCSSIINDNQNNYDKFIYHETADIQERVRAFFAMPEWEMLKGDKELFQRIYKAAVRLVMPCSLAEGLIRHLQGGDFPEPERTELVESLLRSLATERLCREIDYRCDLSLGDTGTEQLESNADFWQYYLMRGFGYRHAKVRGDWESGYVYETQGECYLPAYINYIYAPSREWQKRFVGFDKEKEEIRFPLSARCTMPGGEELRVEFHYHYCLYFVGGRQVDGPVLGFSDLCAYADQLRRAEEFFFLLALTAIGDSDRRAAEALIGQWLGRTPLHPVIIPRVAQMLAADNDRAAGLLSDREEQAAESALKWKDKLETVLYGEQERFCFRALVSESGVSIWRQTDYGWEDRIFRRAEFGWKEYALPLELKEAGQNCPKGLGDEGPRDAGALTPADRRARAERLLALLRQPKPLCRETYNLEGMDVLQKAEKLLEAMGIPEAVEGYCVLRYGERREKRHDRVFYGVCAPFGFDLNTHSPVHVRDRNFRMSVSDTKIKEPKTFIGRFGWGFKYSPSSDYNPIYVYLGESGTFYAYGTIKMHRAHSLPELLADSFRGELEGVTEAETYQGCLTVSKLDHRLEYCYTQEDMRRSMYSPGGIIADGFTVFGGYGMWKEFAGWMDAALALAIPDWVDAIVVGLDWERGGILTFAGIREGLGPEESGDEGEDMDSGKESCQEGDGNEDPMEKTYLPQVPLLVWAKGMDMRDKRELLVSSLQLYVDCGRFGEAVKGRAVKILVNC